MGGGGCREHHNACATVVDRIVVRIHSVLGPCPTVMAYEVQMKERDYENK